MAFYVHDIFVLLFYALFGLKGVNENLEYLNIYMCNNIYNKYYFQRSFWLKMSRNSENLLNAALSKVCHTHNTY